LFWQNVEVHVLLVGEHQQRRLMGFNSGPNYNDRWNYSVQSAQSDSSAFQLVVLVRMQVKDGRMAEISGVGQETSVKLRAV
jgi:hypothetical protein